MHSQPLLSGLGPLGGHNSLENVATDNLQTQDSFGRWMTYIVADSPGSVDDQTLESPISTGHQSFTSPMTDNRLLSALDHIFNITDVSPSWALSTEETKVLFSATVTVWFCLLLLNAFLFMMPMKSWSWFYILVIENKVVDLQIVRFLVQKGNFSCYLV